MRITHKRELDSQHDYTPDELIKFLLEDRNIDDVKTFQNPPSPHSISLVDFGLEKELETTFKTLEEIKKNKKRVVVYTDYDADGITGGTILWETLHLLGFDAMPYVPHRQHEGYGFSVKGIDNVKAQFDPSLIISVDHGITAKEKIEHAKSIGIPVIVTDHHLKPENPPDNALAVFHLPQLSGSGVSYFFSKELFNRFGKESKNYAKLKQYFDSEYLSLASIGTVADLVPLVGPSRSVVKYGLGAFPYIERKGIKCLMQQAGIDGKKITPYEIGFIIAPRINAVGRLEHALDALRLLCTTSEERAFALAGNIGKLNSNRQDLVKSAVSEAVKTVEEMYGENIPNVITLVSENWHEGIIGLISAKITEKFYRPSIVMTKVDGFLKGSARSIPTFHMTNFLRTMKDRLIDVGGHAQAAGFTIYQEQLQGFIDEVALHAKELLKPADLEKIIETDMKIPLNLITTQFVQNLESLQPYGIGNPQPVFTSNAVVTSTQIFGKKNEHLKVTLQDKEKKGNKIEMLAFSKAEDFKKLKHGQEVQIVYTPELHEWNNVSRLQARLQYWQ